MKNTLSTFGSLTAKFIDDSVNECDCCGKTGLKATVLMVNDETGVQFHFGRVCASRNSGKTSQQLTKEVRLESQLAHGRASNYLMDLRRSGETISRTLIKDAAVMFRADKTVLLHHFSSYL